MISSHVLLVDDDPAIRASFSNYLRRAGFTVTAADSLAAGRRVLEENRLDVLLLDLNLPDGNGLDALIEFRDSWPEMPIVVVTASGDVPTAVEAMRRGADHYLTKPVKMADLEVFLRKGIELGRLRWDRLARSRLHPGAAKEEMFFGGSAAMCEVRESVDLAVRSESAVLLLGETGTGKGVLARWIHAHCRRHGGNFVDINCSGIRGDLLASELFGHALGAFTSAVAHREGLLDLAHEGTLFLDEVGDMAPAVQSQFLKVIEEKRFRRLGENTERTSNFRLICATNRDLEAEVKAGRFRRDLLFRINVLPVTIPPLRERSEDIPDLARHLLHLLGGDGVALGPEAISLLKGYDWPGNIREMRNLLERALLLLKGQVLEPTCFPGLSGSAGYGPSRPPALSASAVSKALERSGGNVTGAANILGISRATLYRRIKRLKAGRSPS